MSCTPKSESTTGQITLIEIPTISRSPLAEIFPRPTNGTASGCAGCVERKCLPKAS